MSQSEALNEAKRWWLTAQEEVEFFLDRTGKLLEPK